MISPRILLTILPLLLASTTISAQPYKCKVNGATIIQDRPCTGVTRRADDMPVADTTQRPASDDIQAQREKLEQDKRFIDERVKARILEREKDAAQADINRCESQASSILAKVNQLAVSAPSGQPVNLASPAALQLDQQRRQTQMQSLQAQHSAKLAQCAQKRQAFRDKYGP